MNKENCKINSYVNLCSPILMCWVQAAKLTYWWYMCMGHPPNMNSVQKPCKFSADREGTHFQFCFTFFFLLIAVYVYTYFLINDMKQWGNWSFQILIICCSEMPLQVCYICYIWVTLIAWKMIYFETLLAKIPCGQMLSVKILIPQSGVENFHDPS